MVPNAKYFRQIGRHTQNKQYWWTVLITLVAGILCGSVSIPIFRVTYHTSDWNKFFSVFSIRPTGNWLHFFENFLAPLSGLFTTVSLAVLIVAGATRWGYCRYSLQMHDSICPKPFPTLFSGFAKFGKFLGLQLLILLKVFVWSLIVLVPIALFAVLVMVQIFSLGHPLTILFFLPAVFCLTLAIIACMLPAIRALYSYSLSFYLMVENPDLPVSVCIHTSIQLMQGHKWRMFCLDFSFIGWAILNALTFGILGILFVNPYREFAHVAFYRHLVPAHPASHLWDGMTPPVYHDPAAAQNNPNTTPNF